MPGAVSLGTSGAAVASRAPQDVFGQVGGLFMFTRSRVACTACEGRRVSMQRTLHVHMQCALLVQADIESYIIANNRTTPYTSKGHASKEMIRHGLCCSHNICSITTVESLCRLQRLLTGQPGARCILVYVCTVRQAHGGWKRTCRAVRMRRMCS